MFSLRIGKFGNLMLLLKFFMDGDVWCAEPQVCWYTTFQSHGEGHARTGDGCMFSCIGKDNVKQAIRRVAHGTI